MITNLVAQEVSFEEIQGSEIYKSDLVEEEVFFSLDDSDSDEPSETEDDEELKNLIRTMKFLSFIFHFIKLFS